MPEKLGAEKCLKCGHQHGTYGRGSCNYAMGPGRRGNMRRCMCLDSEFVPSHQKGA